MEGKKKKERYLAYLHIKKENAITSEEREAYKQSIEWYNHVHEGGEIPKEEFVAQNANVKIHEDASKSRESGKISKLGA